MARTDEAVPQRREHAEAAVVGGAAADADEKRPAAAVPGVENHLAQTVGGGTPRVAPVLGHQRKPGGRGHLDDCQMLLGQDAVARRDRRAQRTCHLHALPVASEPGDQRVGGALAAVCHGQNSGRKSARFGGRADGLAGL